LRSLAGKADRLGVDFAALLPEAAAALIVAALALIARSSPFNPFSSAFNTAGFVLTGRRAA
jgi:hypothetical protein